MESNELVLDRGRLLAEETPLSPKIELEYRTKLAALEEENADLKQQLTWLKKQIYGQKSEKTEVILDKGEQIDLFNEAEITENHKEEDRVTVVSHTRKAKRNHEETFGNLPQKKFCTRSRTIPAPTAGLKWSL